MRKSGCRFSARIPRQAFGEDHADFGLNQSKVSVIESISGEADAGWPSENALIL
jgi:hypothetical protein